jgi:hypothetical protein
MSFEEFVQYARRVKREHPKLMDPVWDIVCSTYDKIADDGVPANVQILAGVQSIESLVRTQDFERKAHHKSQSN